MPHSGRNGGIIGTLERFLVDGAKDSAELPPVEALERSGLAAYASAHLGGTSFRPALLAASARHLAVKVEVQRLLRAWQGAGIEALLFKGFHLAEFVYPTPGGRQYSDVDVLIEQRNALQAANLASRLGWRETWHAQRQATAHGLRGARYFGHEVMQLLNPRVGIQMDVHRRLVHNNHNRIRRYARQEQITRMAWERSERVEWDDVSLLLPHPLDAILVGLVLNRCWSPEDFELRSHDYLDFRFLVEKYGVTLEQLQERAQELGCSRTFELFLERCDPFRRRCVLSAPNRFELQRWNLLIASERGNRYLERGWISVNEWPRSVIAVVRQLPAVSAALDSVRRSGGVREAVHELGPVSPRPRKLEADEWQRMRQAVHRTLKLLGFGRFLLRRSDAVSPRDLEALALLTALRRRSCAADLEWRRTASGESIPFLRIAGNPLNVTGTLLSGKPPGEQPRPRLGRRRLPG